MLSGVDGFLAHVELSGLGFDLGGLNIGVFFDQKLSLKARAISGGLSNMKCIQVLERRTFWLWNCGKQPLWKTDS